MRAETVRGLAAECGFELSGVVCAGEVPEWEFYDHWQRAGFAGEMRYLTGHRAEVRRDPRRVLPAARSVIVVGKLYNAPPPKCSKRDPAELAWISRYAWGEDYHDVLRAGLERLARRLGDGHEWRACVDSAPLLERALARRAGLGWIGRNSCLIHEPLGSWFFLGGLLTSLEIEPTEDTVEDRCGTCTACIDACPTTAIVPAPPGGPEWTIDSRRCISYLTIEMRGEIPQEFHAGMGRNVFGCDICQDVCPWNRRAPVTSEPAFQPRNAEPPVEQLAALTEEEFQSMFRRSPVKRAKYHGFRRNVALAKANMVFSIDK